MMRHIEGEGRKVLIIDDDRAVVTTTGGWLERHGFVVSSAVTAAAGLACATAGWGRQG